MQCIVNIRVSDTVLYIRTFLLYCHQVELESKSSNKTYTFQCDRWLADDEDDNAVERELTKEGIQKKSQDRQYKFFQFPRSYTHNLSGKTLLTTHLSGASYT